MIDKPYACDGCVLKGAGTGFIKPEGFPHLGVVMVGEAGGENEEIDGLPFRPFAQAGSILQRGIRRNGYTRKQFRIMNVLQCRPNYPGFPPNALAGMPFEHQAISHCAVHRDVWLKESMDMARTAPGVVVPVILALGDVALRTLTGLAGDKLSVTHLRGYPIPSPHGMVIGTYHPAYVRRSLKSLGVLVWDIEMAVKLAHEGFNPLPLSYKQFPTESEVRDFRYRVIADPSLLVAFDIETIRLEHFERKVFPQITSVQFSTAPGTGIFLNWDLSTIPVIQAIMASANPKAGHNCWGFDVPALAQYDVPTAGIVHDTLWMFHHHQPDLTSEEIRGESETDAGASLSTRAGLQFVASFFGMDFPWKHKNNSNPEFYGIADVDAVQRIMAALPSWMRQYGTWEGYDRKVRQLKPVLTNMEVRGIPVSEAARLDLDGVLEVKKIELDGLSQSLYPHQLKGIDPKNGYTRPPRIVEGKIRQTDDGGYEWYYDPKTKASKKDKKQDAKEGEFTLAKEGPLARWLPLERRTFTVRSKRMDPCVCATVNFTNSKSKSKKPAWKKYAVADCPRCAGAGRVKVEEVVQEERWVKVKPFKPSKAQLIKYMNFKGHKIPKEIKSKKDTTAAAKLQEHAKKYKDPLYQVVLDSRTVDKMKSTYVDGWKPSPSTIKLYDFGGNLIPIGTVHTEFTFAPATGQLSSRGPNAQNTPKHTRNKNLADMKLPDRFRAMIMSRPAKRLWGFDYKSAHALTLGFEARDLSYMRLARLDIHSFLTSVLVGQPLDLSLPDDQLLIGLEEIKKLYKAIRDTQAKPAILGYGFGLGAYKLYDQNKAEMKDGVMVGFNDVRAAQRVLDMLNETFPLTARFRKDSAVKAHKQHYLVSDHGFIRWFWDVYNFMYEAETEDYTTYHGSDLEDAIAFLPANDAFGHIRDAMLLLEEQEINDQANLINNEHDALKFEIPTELEDILVPKILDIMQANSKVLIDPIVAPNGLFIAVEAEVGTTWANMKKVAL